METVRTLLAAFKVPHQYWVEAFAAAIYLINRLPTMPRSSPWKSLFKKVPNYTTLKVFGCLCFLWLKPYTFSKLEPNSKSCIFLGYTRGTNVLMQSQEEFISLSMFYLMNGKFPSGSPLFSYFPYSISHSIFFHTINPNL